MKADRHNSGSSLKELIHYAQIVRTGQFKLFDSHDSKPIERIPFETIDTVPIAYFVGADDDLADPKDTRWSFDRINSAFSYKVYPNMDHHSFQIGKDMEPYITDALAMLAQYNA